MKGLSTFYLQDYFKYILVYGRFAGLVAFLPGWGETYMPGRVKALFILGLAIALTPLISIPFPAIPATPLGILLMLGGEIFIGFFLASLVRIIVSLADLAGTLIGFQIGLANVFTASFVSAQQSGLVGSLFSMFVVISLFLTDMPYLFLNAVIESYEVLKPTSLLVDRELYNDLFNLVIAVLSKSFWLALQLAAPILVISLLITLAGGLMNRAVPQLQIFFILQPLQIIVGLIVIFMILEMAMAIVYGALNDIFTSFWAGGSS